MIDLLTDLLEQARKRGATAGDAFMVEDQAFSAQVRLGQVDTVKHAREQHLALRVFVGRAVAAASTSDLSRESVTKLVDEADCDAGAWEAGGWAGGPSCIRSRAAAAYSSGLPESSRSGVPCTLCRRPAAAATHSGTVKRAGR